MKTEIKKPSYEVLCEAAELIKKGEVVAIPTETVYGLAADACATHPFSEIFCLCGRSLRPISRASSSKRRALVPEVLWSIARIYFMLKTSPFPSRTGYVDPMREEQSLILTVLLRQQ